MPQRRRPAAIPNADAILYVRVSSEEQAQGGFSQEAQLDLLRAYAARTGLRVASEHVVAESAKEAGREAFGRVLDALRRRGGPSHLVVEKTDRLSRNLADMAAVDELRGRGLRIHLVREASVVGPDATASQMLSWEFHAVIARNFIRNHREEVLKGMRTKVKHGLWPTHAPIGYRNCALPDGRRGIEPDPAKAGSVTALFEQCAAGASLLDLEKLAEHRDLRGTGRSRKGKPATRLALKRATIQFLLRNPIYCGDVRWGGEFAPGLHQALVSRDLWQRAQQALDARRTGGRRPRTQAPLAFEFSGLLTCSLCGCGLVGCLRKEGRYTYYRCSQMRGKCGAKYVREQALRDAFAAEFDRQQPDADLAEGLRLLLAAVDKPRLEQWGRDVARLRSEQDRLTRMLDAAYRDCADGTLTRDDYRRYAGEWRAAQESVRAELAALETAHADGLEMSLALLEFASNLGLAFRRAKSSAERRRLLGIVVARAAWGHAGLTLQLTHPFDRLAVAPASEASSPTWWTDLDDIATWLLPRAGTWEKAVELARERPWAA